MAVVKVMCVHLYAINLKPILKQVTVVCKFQKVDHQIKSLGNTVQLWAYISPYLRKWMRLSGGDFNN